jgi:hypothetical protein
MTAYEIRLVSRAVRLLDHFIGVDKRAACELNRPPSESPKFGPNGEIFFRRLEGRSTFVYLVRQDGTGLRKALEQPVQGI